MKSIKEPKDYLCVALDGFDFLGKPGAIELSIRNRVNFIGDDTGWYKVGMELFYSSYGQFDILTLLKSYKIKIFLDLKLKDIALGTIKNTSAVLTSKGVKLFYL